MRRDKDGYHRGYLGHKYTAKVLGESAYADCFDDYLGFLEPRLVRMRELLDKHGSLILHLDCREVHYVKVLLDRIFGRKSLGLIYDPTLMLDFRLKIVASDENMILIAKSTHNRATKCSESSYQTLKWHRNITEAGWEWVFKFY